MEKFLSTPSARRATQKGGENLTDRQISIHALREEGDVKLQELWVFLVYFYPRPPRGGRHGTLSPAAILAVFLSTPSARRATSPTMTRGWQHWAFLSTPSARRATDALPRLSAEWIQISIHALREEGDLQTNIMDGVKKDFYPRPPRGGRRWDERKRNCQQTISIHALREEGDSVSCTLSVAASDFYPRPPRGGRLARRHPTVNVPNISIHALREEGDAMPEHIARLIDLFLSTPSARRATRYARHLDGHDQHFYPRPPRGGRPRSSSKACALPTYFYPRPPRGGRPKHYTPGIRTDVFLSTPSARRATGSRPAPSASHTHFYPRPPRGGRPGKARHIKSRVLFLSTPSARRATRKRHLSISSKKSFLSTPSARRATLAVCSPYSPATFLSTPSARRATCPDTPSRASLSISIHALREEGDSSTTRRFPIL